MFIFEFVTSLFITFTTRWVFVHYFALLFFVFIFNFCSFVHLLPFFVFFYFLAFSFFIFNVLIFVHLFFFWIFVHIFYVFNFSFICSFFGFSSIFSMFLTFRSFVHFRSYFRCFWLFVELFNEVTLIHLFMIYCNLQHFFTLMIPTTPQKNCILANGLSFLLSNFSCKKEVFVDTWT